MINPYPIKFNLNSLLPHDIIPLYSQLATYINFQRTVYHSITYWLWHPRQVVERARKHLGWCWKLLEKRKAHTEREKKKPKWFVPLSLTLFVFPTFCLLWISMLFARISNIFDAAPNFQVLNVSICSQICMNMWTSWNVIRCVHNTTYRCAMLLSALVLDGAEYRVTSLKLQWDVSLVNRQHGNGLSKCHETYIKFRKKCERMNCIRRCSWNSVRCYGIGTDLLRKIGKYTAYF